MILRIESVQVVGSHRLRVQFNDGSSRLVNVAPLLSGSMFEPLRDSAEFAKVSLEPLSGSVVWPNGADLAPEALRDLPDESRAAAS